MSSTVPFFFKTPIRYLKWACIHKPAYFYTCVISLVGPVMIFVVPPIRKYRGKELRPMIPMTYPSTYTTERLSGRRGSIAEKVELILLQYRRVRGRGRVDLRTSRVCMSR